MSVERLLSGGKKKEKKKQLGMLGTLYICCSAGDAVKRPLEVQGDRPRQLGELESNLLFALGVSALAASF